MPLLALLIISSVCCATWDILYPCCLTLDLFSYLFSTQKDNKHLNYFSHPVWMSSHFIVYLENISSQGAETSICWRSEDVIQAVWANNGFFTGLCLRVCQQGPFNSLKFDKTRARCVSVSVFVSLLNRFSVNMCSTSSMFGVRRARLNLSRSAFSILH